MINIERVNEAIDKGWRLREAGPVGFWCLVPPEAIEADLGLSVKEANNFNLIVPSKDLEAWLEARVVITPDEKKRNELKAKVVNWMSAQWNSILAECYDDKDYAREVIVADASSDFNVPLDDVKEWFDASRS